MLDRSHRLALPAFCLFLLLCLPLQAQVGPRSGEALAGFLSNLWARLGAPLAFIWGADATDGRGAVDPDGRTVNTDGRGACDPDGVTACGS